MGWFTTMALVGIGINAYSQWKAGKAAKDAGDAARAAAEDSAALDEYNAAVARLQAKDAVERGALDEARFRSGVESLISTQRAGFAAAGVVIGDGSALDVQADAALLGEMDALTLRNNAAREAWGFEVQAEDLMRQAQITRKTGVAAARRGQAEYTAAKIGAVGGVVRDVGTLINQRYPPKPRVAPQQGA